MASGGSWDPEEDIKKLAENPVETIASGIANVFTVGLVGVEDGKLTRGASIRALDEGLGEISGRNVARKGAMETKDALNASKLQAERERKFALQQQEARERQQSGMAASQSRRAQGGSTGTSGVEQDMATQFLGL